MAYPVAAGNAEYSGTFIPEIWSSKLLTKFYDSATVPSITNTDYEGEIKNSGDKVIIRTVPDVTIRDYVKGQELIYEQPESANIELLIDQGHYWAVNIDDVDKAQWDIDWMNKFSDDAGEQTKIKVDTNVFNGIKLKAHVSNMGTTAGRNSRGFNLGISGAPVALSKTNILDYIAALGTVLDEQNVPETGRFLVLPPIYIWMLKTSDLKDASLTGDGTSVLRNGRVGMIDRFETFSSNLLPYNATDSAYYLLAGTKDATTFAAQVTRTEKLRAQTAFGELVRGLMVYGYQVIKPECLAMLYASKA